MTANELRIGNLVKNNEPRYEDKILVIESIGDNDTVNCFFRPYTLSVLEPLMITEDYLIKYGFKKYPNCRDTFRQEYYDEFQLDIDRYTIISFSIAIGYNNITCNYNKLYRSEENKKDYKIKYVHQLQNLYFALTGEELTFKSE